MSFYGNDNKEMQLNFGIFGQNRQSDIDLNDYDFSYTSNGDIRIWTTVGDSTRDTVSGFLSKMKKIMPMIENKWDQSWSTVFGEYDQSENKDVMR